MPALFTVKTHCSVGPGSGMTTLGRDEEQPMLFYVFLFFLCARRSAARVAVVACEVQLEAAEVFCGVLR